MADAKPRADDAGADDEHGGNATLPDGASSTTSIGTPWRRILIIAVPVVVALAIATVVFALWGPTPVSISVPSGSPSASSRPTPDPSTPPAEQPAVPDDEPVTIDEPATITPGLTAEITTVEAVEGVARGPGEVAGPSLRLTITIANTTAADAPLDTTVVSAYYGADRTPAPELRQPGGSPLPSSIAAGASATGIYIFSVPEEERGNTTIMVDYSVDVDPLVFQGDIRTLINR